ncbi:hypothetical protein KSP40_PGU015545 [Platanthera guangdongensis]|uniref:Uncharacterized protein n=1 Tax=Platanthera guangdongensis TaxID=2320717 RepID=A0ABR2LS10_9ASPA
MEVEEKNKVERLRRLATTCNHGGERSRTCRACDGLRLTEVYTIESRKRRRCCGVGVTSLPYLHRRTKKKSRITILRRLNSGKDDEICGRLEPGACCLASPALILVSCILSRTFFCLRYTVIMV